MLATPFGRLYSKIFKFASVFNFTQNTAKRASLSKFGSSNFEASARLDYKVTLKRKPAVTSVQLTINIETSPTIPNHTW